MEKDENTIKAIDCQTKRLLFQNKPPAKIFKALYAYTPFVLEQIKTIQASKLHRLCNQYAGFYAFIAIVNACLGQAMQSQSTNGNPR